MEMIAKRCLLLPGVLLFAVAAYPQTCMQDAFDAFNGTTKSLGCTANDVSVAAVDDTSIHIFQGGIGDKCLAGSPFSFTATFDIKTTSSKTRSNIGIYFGTKQSNALTGTCSQEILAPRHPCAFVNGTATATCGSLQYEELDGPINGETAGGCTTTNGVTTCTTAGCGDTTSGDTSSFGPGTQAATLEVDGVTCPTTGTSITLPVCTSWYQPASGLPVCESPGPNYPWQASAVPGTSSKCSCGTLTIPVQPIQPSVKVAKSCNTTATTGANQVSCDEGAGDVANNVTYHVNISNTTPANEGGVIIDQICDSVYGTIYKSASFTGTACAAGSIGTNGSLINGCTPNPTDIPNGGSATCDFTAHQNENLTETDTVTVQGHSDLATTTTFGPTSSNSVTVTSEDSPSTSKTTKGLASTQAACATVRYNVTVQNTSGADEIISLSTPFSDSAYLDITTVHGNVLGTTCGVATSSAGLGTLSANSGAGALPTQISAGGSYTCQFDGEFCGPIVNAEQFGTGTCTNGTCTAGKAGSCTVNSDCDTTCTGISQTDTVRGTITGDESETVSQTIVGLNVTECLASFTSSH